MRGVLLWSLLAMVLLASCKKADEKITAERGARLEFSTDTVLFDTIFTSVGSISKSFYVYNRNKNAVNISNIRLGQLSPAQYSLIIDGKASNNENDVELRGGDSLLILARVKIDPQDKNTPYLVADSVIFETNGNVQNVKLVAYGQDANFFNNTVLPCNTLWDSPKPYVLMNKVTVPASCTLTVGKGVRVLGHNGAQLSVQGTLLVEGEPDSLVTFSSDRLSSDYKDVPGQWGGLVIESGSTGNSIDWAVIKNGTTGIQLAAHADADTLPELLISNTIVKNMSSTCINAEGTDLKAYNLLAYNAADNIASCAGGGNYTFLQSTFAAYSYVFLRSGSAVYISNKGESSSPLTARFTNCIVWGDLVNTDEIDRNDDGSSGFDLLITNSIVRTNETLPGTGNLENKDPLFIDPQQQNYRPDTLASPALDAGINAGVLKDLDNKPRDSKPDIGAYEK